MANQSAVSMTFKNKDPKKGSVRWNADSNIENPMLQSIYINKPFFEDATEIKVTIEKVK